MAEKISCFYRFENFYLQFDIVYLIVSVLFYYGIKFN